MITECRIKWLDDGDEVDVLIYEYDSLPDDSDIDDNDIFYYGMSKSECEYARYHEEDCGGWVIVEVY